MTSIATDTPTVSSPKIGEAKRQGASRIGTQRSALRPVLIAVIVIGGLGLAAWAVATWLGAGATVALADRAIVEPRTFTVVLKEKGELRAARSTDIKSEVEGRSTIISLIPEGTAVEKGQLLVELASDEIENRILQEELKEANAITAYEAAKTDLDIQRDKNTSDIRKAELQIELMTLELGKYREGEWIQKLKDADIAIEQAKMTVERREQDFNAFKELLAKDFTTRTEYDEAEFNFKKAEWDLEKAYMAKAVLEEYTHIADLKRRESDLHEAIKEAERVKKGAEAEELRKIRILEGREKELALTKDQLAKLRMQKEKCRIYAPTQGFVVYYTGGGGRWFMNSDNQIKEGAAVFERQILMQLPDTSVMNAVVRVHEAKTDRLRLGQRAVVSVEGIPGREFTGRVSKIAVLADSQSTWLNPDLKEYETEITLDATDAPLKPSVTAHAEILVETVADKLAIPVQAVYARSGQRYVFRDSRGSVEPVPITLGSIGQEWAEVVNGIAQGDSILLAFGDDLKRKVPDLQNERNGSPGDASPETAPRRAPGVRREGRPTERASVTPGASTDVTGREKADSAGAAVASAESTSTSDTSNGSSAAAPKPQSSE